MACATGTGSTAEVPAAIARCLSQASLSAKVHPVAKVSRLEGYSGAVLGTAVRYSAWLPKMTNFLVANRDALAAMPVALYTMCVDHARLTRVGPKADSHSVTADGKKSCPKQKFPALQTFGKAPYFPSLFANNERWIFVM